MKEKVILLIPLQYNDGSVVPVETVEEILHELYAAYGGYTEGREVRGAYRMSGGYKQVDKLLEVWVVVESDTATLADLRRKAALFARRLGQESLYMERTGGSVEFVESDSVEGESHD